MSLKAFNFKQFSVAHDRCSHKVGTDGVLLGSWVNIVETDKRILDIGTGSGLIALMLAQRTNDDVRIDAIEIEQEDTEQARENVARSPWPARISVVNTSAQKFNPQTPYDLVISNPPYFTNSLLPPAHDRKRARHTGSLGFQDLLETVARNLSPHGRFAVILPCSEAQQLMSMAKLFKLFPLRTSTFHARKHKPPERRLIEFSYSKVTPQNTEIILYEKGDHWSEDYRLLTKEFYLKA